VELPGDDVRGRELANACRSGRHTPTFRRFRGNTPHGHVPPVAQPLVDHVVRLITIPWNGPAIGSHEIPAPLMVRTDVVAPLMDQTMMPTAQQHRIREARLAPIGPMADVVRIDEASVRTAGKGAAAIPGPQGALERRRHRALLAPDIQGLAVGPIHHRHDTAVAAQAFNGFHGQVRAPFTPMERRAIHVNHHLIGIGGARAR